MSPFILASASMTRARILKACGADFIISPSSIDESEIKLQSLREDRSASWIASKLAEKKALNISESMPGLTLASDQTLEFNNLLFDKPASIDIARKQLVMLRGHSHQLHTAAALAENGAIIWSTLDTSTLTMRNFSEDFLEHYLKRNEKRILNSVGCYELESEGAQLFEAIEGDYFSILGLPLLPVLGALRDFGALGR